MRFAYLGIMQLVRNRCLERASALSFQTIFSLIPAVALTFLVFRTFGGLEDMGASVRDYVFHQLNVDQIYVRDPETGEEIKLQPKIEQYVERVYRQLDDAGVSILWLIWLVYAAMVLMLTIEKTLSDIWGVQRRRPLVRRIALYWSVFTLGPLLVGVSILLGQQIADKLPYQGKILELGGPLVALYLIYTLMPGTTVRFVPAIIGALVATVLWHAAKDLFALYLAQAVGPGRMYGNLGVIPIFLLWVFLGWVIVLFGAQLAYTIQNRDRLDVAERRRGSPFADAGLLAAAVVLAASRAFSQGQRAIDAERVRQITGLSEPEWRPLVTVLVEHGMLQEAGGDQDRFALARPASDIPVEEVFAVAERKLHVSPALPAAVDRQGVQHLVDRLAESRQRELGGLTIADLLEQAASSRPAEDEA